MRYALLFVIMTLFPLPGAAQQVHLYYVPDTISFRRPAAFGNIGNYSIRRVQKVPADIYTQHFGFFCRQELKMHKAHIPMSFRLGSMDQCDMLEQKGSKVR